MRNSTSPTLSTAESSPGSPSASSNGSPATNQLDLPLNTPSGALNVFNNQLYLSADEYPDEDEDDDGPPPDAEGRGPIVPPTMGGTGKQTQRPTVRQPTSPLQPVKKTAESTKSASSSTKAATNGSKRK